MGLSKRATFFVTPFFVPPLVLFVGNVFPPFPPLNIGILKASPARKGDAQPLHMLKQKQTVPFILLPGLKAGKKAGGGKFHVICVSRSVK